ncbi:metallophosphoesterase family protein [Fuscovulum blasticum]|uniref:metallophosphoesterase family protein n=1 Tax=Fuscovulum blasticum TaxID=1075 RepID=UPI000D3E481F|nr:metallophosphoesterase family protein [Fuscovulum blasticum]AWD22372.1 serine/threonine protein phosphatase [Fuscovulum blasticum]
MRAYAIGDIHGQLALLKAAHDRIAADIARHGPAPVVHVGDLVDRGPDSRGVIDLLLEGQAAGQDWVVLKGNHDRLFTMFLDDPQAQDHRLRSDLSWLHPRLGGAETLASYGVRAAADRPVAPVHADGLVAVPASHRAFLQALPLTHRIGDVLFVHAGIRPGVALDAQAEDDLLWIRQPFLEDTRDHGPLIVHGHTALDAPTHYGNRVNIDSSAGYGGPLTAIAIEGREVFLLTEAGRVPLVPGL